MANLRGKGSFTGVNLLARTYDNAVTKDGKTQFLDVQVDARDARAAGDNNLHLTSTRTKDQNGKDTYNNSAAYTSGQYEDMQAAAGPNSEPILNKDGEKIGQVLAFKANVMPSQRGNGLVVNTKSLEQSDHKVDSQTLDNQYAAMKEAGAAAKAAAPEQSAEAQAEAPQVAEAEAEAEEPAIG